MGRRQKSAKIWLSKSISMSKIIWIFLIFFSLLNINLEAHFLLLSFFGKFDAKDCCIIPNFKVNMDSTYRSILFLSWQKFCAGTNSKHKLIIFEVNNRQLGIDLQAWNVINISISSMWWVLKSKNFGQKSIY